MSGVQSVERALAILRALGTGPAGVTELADRVELPKSTVSRMLSTLETAGAVEQLGGGGPYRLGPLIAEIAAAIAPTASLIDLAMPVLSDLTRTTGEASGLAVREGFTVRFVLQTRPDNEVQVKDWTGTTNPLHVGPSGLVMLSHLPEATIDQYLSGELVAFTPATVVDPKAIRRRLQAIRRTGSEWVFGEFSVELSSVAAPVFDRQGAVVAAVHVHGPSFRFPADGDRRDVATQVSTAADRLTELLKA
jgi:DNA-binding IclR family transcriptional regulator